jgi:hypothetical protein
MVKDGLDPLEIELAEAIVEAAEGASGLTVRVGIADGKFAAYVAAMLGSEPYPQAPRGAGSEE